MAELLQDSQNIHNTFSDTQKAFNIQDDTKYISLKQQVSENNMINFDIVNQYIKEHQNEYSEKQQILQQENTRLKEDIQQFKLKIKETENLDENSTNNQSIIKLSNLKQNISYIKEIMVGMRKNISADTIQFNKQLFQVAVTTQNVVENVIQSTVSQKLRQTSNHNKLIRYQLQKHFENIQNVGKELVLLKHKCVKETSEHISIIDEICVKVTQFCLNKKIQQLGNIKLSHNLDQIDKSIISDKLQESQECYSREQKYIHQEFSIFDKKLNTLNSQIAYLFSQQQICIQNMKLKQQEDQQIKTKLVQQLKHQLIDQQSSQQCNTQQNSIDVKVVVTNFQQFVAHNLISMEFKFKDKLQQCNEKLQKFEQWMMIDSSQSLKLPIYCLKKDLLDQSQIKTQNNLFACLLNSFQQIQQINIHHNKLEAKLNQLQTINSQLTKIEDRLNIKIVNKNNYYKKLDQINQYQQNNTLQKYIDQLKLSNSGQQNYLVKQQLLTFFNTIQSTTNKQLLTIQQTNQKLTQFENQLKVRHIQRNQQNSSNGQYLINIVQQFAIQKIDITQLNQATQKLLVTMKKVDNLDQKLKRINCYDIKKNNLIIQQLQTHQITDNENQLQLQHLVGLSEFHIDAMQEHCGQIINKLQFLSQQLTQTTQNITNKQILLKNKNTSQQKTIQKNTNNFSNSNIQTNLTEQQFVSQNKVIIKISDYIIDIKQLSELRINIFKLLKQNQLLNQQQIRLLRELQQTIQLFFEQPLLNQICAELNIPKNNDIDDKEFTFAFRIYLLQNWNKKIETYLFGLVSEVVIGSRLSQLFSQVERKQITAQKFYLTDNIENNFNLVIAHVYFIINVYGYQEQANNQPSGKIVVSNTQKSQLVDATLAALQFQM